MALATLSDALPPAVTEQPGLSARVSSLASGVQSLLADLDPGLLLGRDATALYRDFCRIERLVVAAKTLLAPRIAESGAWAEDGHRSPTGLLADLEGGTAGAARRTLELGQRLASLPGCEEALRAGQLSGPKLDALTRAASLDPASEGDLLAGAGSEPLHLTKERCARATATAASGDPVAAQARIHRARSFTSWTDAEGAFCYQGRDSAERGARLLARLAPVADRLRHDRRRAAATSSDGARGGRHPGGAPPEPVESDAALRADALFLLMTGTRSRQPSGAVPCERATTDPPTADTTTAHTTTGLADPDDLGRTDDLVGAPPPATVIVRVDLAALRRGRARSGELAEVEGQGPVTVDVVRSLIDDAFLACVFTEAGDIRAVAHLGRTINAHLRTALALRDRHCVVPRCGVGYSLEIDHVHPLERGGRTELSNLALLCRHHHYLKTYEGWTLERTGPTDEDPRWVFAPQPEFGQEPDLGLDRPDRLRRPGGRDGPPGPPGTPGRAPDG